MTERWIFHDAEVRAVVSLSSHLSHAGFDAVSPLVTGGMLLSQPIAMVLGMSVGSGKPCCAQISLGRTVRTDRRTFGASALRTRLASPHSDRRGPPASRAVSSMQAHGRGRVHVALRLLRRLLPLALPRSSGLRTSPHPALRPTSHSVCMVSPPPRCSRAHTAPPRHCRGPRRSWEKWATGSAPRALRQQRRRRRQGREGRPRSPRARPSQPKPNQPRPSQPSPSQPSHQSSQPTPPTQPSHRQPSQPTPPTQPSQVTASASHSHSAVHLHVHPHGVHLWL